MMRGRWARLMVVGITVFSALALTAPMALADSRVPQNSKQIGPVLVRVYSLMCDGLGGQPLHTRLNIKNTSSTPQTVMVNDSAATKITYDPPGPIAPGAGMLVHLTSPRSTPAHDITIIAGGETGTVPVPKSPCVTPTTTPSITTGTTKPPVTNPTGPTTPTVAPTIPSNPGGGPPVGGPGIVDPGGIGGSGSGSGGSSSGASGSLPFTGSDIRLFALLGDLMVLIGFALLLISHRSSRAKAMLNKLGTNQLTLDQVG